MNSDGTLNFHEFMRKLGVDLRASDNGFSEQIANENVASEFERYGEIEIVRMYVGLCREFDNYAMDCEQ